MKLLNRLFAFVIFLIFFSCLDSENLDKTDPKTDLLNHIEKIYNVKTSITTMGYKLEYPDSRHLFIENYDNKTIVYGTKINNEKFEVNIGDNNLPVYDRIEFNTQKENSKNNKQNFILAVNSYNDPLAMGKPCDEHPGEEEFDDCFEREWDEFCDGFIGCMAQITNGPLIAAVIAIHCAACGGDEEEK